MTICIAAIAEKDKIIAIADKMLTIPNADGSATSYEVTDINKVFELNEKTLAMFSGNSVHATQILALAKDKITANVPTTVLEAAEKVKEAYKEYWNSLVSNALDIKYGIDFKTFMNNQNAFGAELIKHVNDFATTFALDIQVLIAGIGADDKPRIYYLDNGGSVIDSTSFGYASIGSGQQHANLSLIESEYSASYDKNKSLYCLIEAKKRAEYDPGVGKYCDIALINGKFIMYDTAKVNKLNRTFEKSRTAVRGVKRKYYTEIKKVVG